MNDIFDRIFSAHELEQAVITTLQKWMKTYLTEMALQYDMEGTLALPRSYTTKDEMVPFPDDTLPAVIVVSGGMEGMPEMTGDGVFNAVWRLGVAVVSKGPDKVITNRNSKIYAAAVRAIMLQQRGLGGKAAGMYWVGEDYTDTPADSERTLAVCVSMFNVVVPHVVNREAGPVGEPDDGQPGQEPHDVESVYLVVEKEDG